MDGIASRRPLSYRMRIGSVATLVAASVFLFPNVALTQSGVIVDESVLDQLGLAKRGARQPSATPRRSDVQSTPLPTAQPKMAEPRRPVVEVSPTSDRRAALKDPPAKMPRSRFLAPHLAPAEPKAAKPKQTASTSRKRTPAAKSTSRIVPPTAPAAPKIATPTPPSKPMQPRVQTPVKAVPAIVPPPPPAIAGPGDTPPAKQMASLPAARAAEAQVLPGGDLYRLPFSGEAAALGEKNSKLLDKLADRLKRDPSLRLQLLGFADSSESASQARRVSLFRALAVRTYLMKQGVSSTRMDVRALGSRSDDAPPNRVDIQIKK